MQRPYRNRRGNRWNDNRHFSQNSRDDGQSTEGNQTTPRHPPHLRGREIGLYYASLAKKSPNKREKTIETVCLDSHLVSNVRHLLAGFEPISKETTNFWKTKYQNLSESCFKKNFLLTLKGNDSTHFANVSDSFDLDADSPNPELDLKLRDEFLLKCEKPEYQKMFDQRSKLPVFDRCEEILKAVEENQVIVICGETGCGKSTQIVQFLLDDALKSLKGSSFHAICTQPRRIAATSVAQRVAEERCESIGNYSNGSNGSVGYQIRLECRKPRTHGSILFCTTGILVQYLQSDPYLLNISHLLIDEVHERDVLTDFLLTIARDLLPKRPQLRIILMSATINAEMFSNYFNSCPILTIPGMTFPIKNLYLEDILCMTEYRIRPKTPKKFRGKSLFHDEDVKYTLFITPFIEELESNRSYPYHVTKSLRMRESEDSPEELMLELLTHIHNHERGGAILIFLTGWEQISRLHKELLSTRLFSSRKFLILPLHSMMPTMNQKQVFDRPPPGVRKIILSTNIAETSVTIEDVVFVIDSGKIKLSNFDSSRNLATLQSEWISAANGRQRQGRAGRTQPGICYHLYSRYREQSLASHPTPEMRRMRLEELILRVKILKLGRVDIFLRHVPEPPEEKTVSISLQLLRTLGALDESESLTPLGFHLAQLPTDPRTGKLILLAAIFGCLEPIVSIASALSFKDPFVIPLHKEDLVRRCKKSLAQGSCSDHLLIAKIMSEYRSANQRGWSEARSYCYQHFLSSNTMSLLSDMANQFCKDLHERRFISDPSLSHPAANINSGNEKLIRALLCAGLFPNVAQATPKRSQRPPKIVTPQDGKVEIHPKSLNYDSPELDAGWLCYHTKVKTTSIFLHDVSEVSPLSLMFFGAAFQRSKKSTQSTMENIHVGEGINFLCNSDTADVIELLRRHWDELLMQRVSNPGPTDWSTSSPQSAILKIIIDVVTSEPTSTCTSMRASTSTSTRVEAAPQKKKNTSRPRYDPEFDPEFDGQRSAEESMGEWDDSENDLSFPEDIDSQIKGLVREMKTTKFKKSK